MKPLLVPAVAWFPYTANSDGLLLTPGDGLTRERVPHEAVHGARQRARLAGSSVT